MCDYSLQNVQSRAAQIGDKLTVKRFPAGTRGFAASENRDIAVCVLPGTEISFAETICEVVEFSKKPLSSNVAIFRQVDKDCDLTHHDALELPDGHIVKLNNLNEGQEATVLQLPAAPRTEQEAKDQTRLETVG
jgi:hypothetical protein